MFNDIQKAPAKLLVNAAGAICVSAMLATTAAGQSASSGSSSSSSSSAQVSTSSTSSAAGGHSNAQIYLDQRTPGEITTNHRYGGSYTVRNAPAVQPPSMGSGHPCSLSSSVGISLIGGGAAGGNSRVDEACLLAQMGQGQAALIMIARRDSEACQALRQVGTLPPSSVCTANERRQAAQVQRASFAATTTPQSATTQAPRPLSSYVTCSRRDDGVILARKQRGTPFNDEQVADYCRSKMQ